MSFNYSRGGGTVSLKADGNVLDLTAEVGYMVNNLYSTMMNQNPVVGLLFKSMVQDIMSNDSPTWEVQKPQEGETSIMFEVPKGVFGDGE